MARRVYKQVFHGTHWTKPSEYHAGWFDYFDSGMSDFGAIWFTQVEKDAHWFVDFHADSDTEVTNTQVVFMGRLVLRDAYVLKKGRDEYFKIGPWEFEGGSVCQQDMYEAAMSIGKNAFIVPVNYEYGGDDIAVFDLSGFSLQGIKIKLPGHDWTKYMEAEVAVNLFKQFWGWSEDA